MSTAAKEIRRAISALALEVPEEVHKDLCGFIQTHLNELEDAQRIAWCLTVGIEQRDSSLGDATWLFRVDGAWHLAVRRDSEVLGHWFTLSHGAYPALSQQARALIDAARSKEGTET